MIKSPLLWQRVRFFGAALFVFSSVLLASAAEEMKKNFSLSAGDAATTLKQFSEQSGEQIVYPVDRVRGMQTNAVSGELTAHDALERMVAGSGLVVMRDDKTGAFAVRPSVDREKNAPGRSGAEAAALSPAVMAPLARTSASSGDGADKTVELTPFEVSTDSDQGYQAANTMSGTRINSRLDELPASLTVVTKQQLLDTAATDINDIFRYEASTEGIYQYTAFNVDRGNVSDEVASNPSGATRMRGLTAANIATGGFTTTLPVDSYNIDAVEISRGPNSSLFGLGATGGGVNILQAKGVINKSITSFATQGDTYDGYRTNFDLNRTIIKDKLAVRVLGLYEEKGYVRKPSQDTTRRLEVAMTARPFRSMTIRGTFESYRNFNSRPNSKTPFDGVTDWRNSGSPSWDPTTSTVHFGNGQPAIVGVVESTEATVLPYGLESTNSALTTFPSWYIENGAVQRYEINRMPAATGIGPNSVTGVNRMLQSGTFLGRSLNATASPLFLTRGVTDRSIYDWTSINLSAPNYDQVKGETTTIELEQVILHTERQTLALQAGWLYERTSDNSRAFLGNSDGGKAQIYIDVNEKLLDGTPNPYFLRPYVGGSQPSYKKARANNENYRGTLAYELNLSHETNWLRWLGTHRFSGYGEYRSIYGGSLGFRDTMSSNEAWMTPDVATFSRNSASFRSYPKYYIGDAKSQNVDYAPQRLNATNGNLTLRYFNAVTGQWVNEPVTFGEYYYANRLNRRLLSTMGGTWQGFFFHDRIIPVLGIRKDNNRTRDGNSAINPTNATNGYYDTTGMNSFGQYDWVQQMPDQKGITRTAGIVVKATNWVSLTYNQSNAFSPGSLAYNIYGVPLSDPRGKTKDYGFYFSLFKNKLNISAKQYETQDIGRGTSEINTIVQRAVRLDADGNTAAGDPDLEGFLITEYGKLGLTEEQAAPLILKTMGVDPNFIDSHRNKTHGDDGDAFSRGQEVEITYNPTNYLRMKATVTRATTFNGILSPNLQKYVDSRLPTWTSVVSPFDNSSYWNGTYKVGNLTPQGWYLQNLLAPLKLAVALQGKARTQTREWHFNYLTNFKFSGVTENRWLKNLDVGGGMHWEDKGSIGYYGAPADADGIVRSYDPNRPVWDKSHFTFDFWTGYNFRFFQDRVRARLQLNLVNAFENGHLQPIAVNPDGTPWLYRIVDPRKLTLSARFDL